MEFYIVAPPTFKNVSISEYAENKNTAGLKKFNLIATNKGSDGGSVQYSFVTTVVRKARLYPK